jgi:hypothetical protein
MTKRLVVVGNAEPTEDCSKFIDQCDIVVRFNYTLFFETNRTGRRTTIFCLFGVPYPEAREIPRLNADIVKNCQTIWVESSAFFEPLTRGYKVPREKIILMNLHVIKDDYAIDGAERIARPSSGFQVLRYLVNRGAFAHGGYRKFICGFEWRGGGVHRWDVEKQQVARYVELKLLNILDDRSA